MHARRARQRRAPTPCRSTATPRPRSRRRRTCSSSTWRSSGQRPRRSRAAACWPTGTTSRPAAAVDLDADLDRGAGRRRGQARPGPQPGRRHHARRRRRLRRQDRASRGRRRCWCRGPPGCSASRSSSPRTGASTSSPARTSGRSSTTCAVGFDDDGRILGLDVRFWHDNGAYVPYGLIVPIVTSTQLLGPYKPAAYRVEFDSLYTNTVHRHAVPGRRAAAGLLRDGAHDGRDRGGARAWTATLVRERNFIQPERDALRPGADLPGRPAADLRLRRLPGAARASSRT